MIKCNNVNRQPESHKLTRASCL